MPTLPVTSDPPSGLAAGFYAGYIATKEQLEENDQLLQDQIDAYPTDSVQTLANSAALVLTADKKLIPVAGSGGAVTGITIPNGTTNGQPLVLIGTSDTNTVSFPVNGATNIAADNGQTARVLGNCDVLQLFWYGTRWIEASFKNNL